jgi:hypothetical protein
LASDDWHPLDDDEPLIERDAPAVVYRLERAWRCRAVRLGEAYGGLWAFTRGDKQAVSFGVILHEGEAIPPATMAVAWPLVTLSALPLIAVVGDRWARVTSPDQAPAASAFRPV